MKKYVIALDEGTTSTRCIMFDHNCNIISCAQHEFTQIYPQPGWVEHNAMEIYASQYATLTECIAKSGVSLDEIDSIGITNQRETTVIWDKNTGKPIYNAIVWQCRRTAEICTQLENDGYTDYIVNATGLRPDAYFSATKIKWILDNVPGAREKAENGDLLFGTIDTWLVWKLTDGKVHVTDRTNASRTMLYNLHDDDWDDKLLSLLSIPKCILPKICSSSEVYGYVNIMGSKIAISGIAGDQQSALFGQGCFEKGDSKNTYGTGCFMLLNTGEEPVFSKNGLITTVCATAKGAPIQYALEGSVFVGGAVIQWLRDELHLIEEAPDSEYFATKINDSNGVYIIPAFAGLGAPHWDMQARGAIFGLTRGSNRNHIIRAALESIAYQTEDVLQSMQNDLNIPIHTLKVDGGAAANHFLMQFQSDISNLTVLRPRTMEATALGAAFLAGLATGFFSNQAELKNKIRSTYIYEPKMSQDTRASLIKGWKKAVNACKSF